MKLLWQILYLGTIDENTSFNHIINYLKAPYDICIDL